MRLKKIVRETLPEGMVSNGPIPVYQENRPATPRLLSLRGAVGLPDPGGAVQQLVAALRRPAYCAYVITSH